MSKRLSILMLALAGFAGTAMAADTVSPADKNPNPGPVARAEEKTKDGARKAGSAVKRTAKKAGHAVGTGTKKTGDAISRTGQKVKNKTEP